MTSDEENKLEAVARELYESIKYCSTFRSHAQSKAIESYEHRESEQNNNTIKEDAR